MHFVIQSETLFRRKGKNMSTISGYEKLKTYYKRVFHNRQLRKSFICSSAIVLRNFAAQVYTRAFYFISLSSKLAFL